MNKNKKYILIALLASLLFTVVIGFSMWIILSEQARGAIQSMGTLTYTTGDERYAGESWEGTATYTYTLDGATKTYTVNGTYTVDLDSKSSTNISAVKEAKACTVTFQPSSEFAKWVWDDTITLQNRSIVLKAVAYIDQTYYTTVDAALSAVANATTATTVNVIPSGDHDVETKNAAAAKTITQNFTIKPSVTLRLSNGVTAAVGGTINIQPDIATEKAYDFTRVDDGTKEGLFLIYSQFSGVGTHSDAYFRTDWCENIVTVKSGVTLTNSGTITIDAVVTGAAGGSHYSSIVFGNYSKISMQSGGKITNTGTINCYGFIDEATPDYDYTDNAAITDATVQLDMQAGTLNTVFTISEHRGGNVFMGMVNPSDSAISNAAHIGLGSWPTIQENKVYAPQMTTFAFHRFFIQSVSVNTQVSSSALVKGEVSMYANEGPNQAMVSFLGTSSASPLFSLSGADSYATFKYTHNQDASKRKLDLDLYGNSALNPLRLRLTIKKEVARIGFVILVIEMKTAESLMPISHYYDVSFNRIGTATATVDLTQQELKILPGGSLTIGQGVTANTSRIAIYESNKLLNGLAKSGLTETNPANSGTFSSYGIAQGLDYPALAAGKLTVNGTLNASAVGGPVLAGTDNAVLNITSGNTVVSPELLHTYDATITLIRVYEQAYAASYFSTDADSTLTAKGDQWTVGADKATNAPLAIGQYVAKSGAWATPTSIKITFNSMGGSAVASQTYTTNSYNGVTLSSLPKPTRTHYEFDTWCTDSALQNDANGVTVHTDTTLYAKWTPIPYTLNFEYVYTGDFSDLTKPTLPGAIEFTVLSTEEDIGLDQINPTVPDGEDYKFNGWYTDPSCSAESKVTAIDGATLLGLNNGQKIYGSWVLSAVTINYNNGGDAFSKYFTNTSQYVTFDDLATTGLLPVTDYSSNTTREYFFDGWYYGDTKVTDLNFVDTEDVDNTTYELTARWTQKVSITYTANMNVYTDLIADRGYATYWHKSGTVVTLPNVTSRDATTTDANLKYYFGSWTQDGNALSAEATSITLNANTVVNITWGTKATLTVDYANGTNSVLNYTNEVVYIIPGRTHTIGKNVNAGDSVITNKWFFKQWTLSNCTISGSTITVNSGVTTAKATVVWGSKHIVKIIFTSYYGSEPYAILNYNSSTDSGDKIEVASGGGTYYVVPGTSIKAYVDGQWLGYKSNDTALYIDDTRKLNTSYGKYDKTAVYTDITAGEGVTTKLEFKQY